LFFFRKDKLLKALEDLEERAEVDVLIDPLTNEKIQEFAKIYQKLQVNFFSAQSDFEKLMRFPKRQDFRGLSLLHSLTEHASHGETINVKIRFAPQSLRNEHPIYCCGSNVQR